MKNFTSLGVSNKVAKSLEKIGYINPTDIQKKSIPLVYSMQDIIGIAQTGTGKTGSFLIPLIDTLDKEQKKPLMPNAVILEPTRELAIQVMDSFKSYSNNSEVNATLLIGGAPFNQQEKEITKGANIVIATPGRLIDFINREKIILLKTNVLIIDEADKMLDMGFIPDIEEISSKTSPIRQTLMFSATFEDKIKILAQKFLNSPKEIKVSKANSSSKNIKQFYIKVDENKKFECLKKILKDKKKTIVFVNKKDNIDKIARKLDFDFKVGKMHGNMSQEEREESLSNFKKNKSEILICSDIIARGIDIPSVNFVINYELPVKKEDYVHRIGRTGRASKKGTAFTLVNKYENDKWKEIIKLSKSNPTMYKIDKKEKTNKEAKINKEVKTNVLDANKYKDKAYEKTPFVPDFLL